jgi:hypothetical protein
MDASLTWQIIHWSALFVGTAAAYRYFRDLGDITQAVMTVTRKNMVFAIRHEYGLIIAALAGTAIAGFAHYFGVAGIGWVFKTVAFANIFMAAFPYIWLHFGLRNQQDTATYYSIEEAEKFVRPGDSVIVLENNGEARAHPDYHIKRPHLAGTPEGLGGENVIMTYCCLTHLGLGYKPEIDGKTLNLDVAAQLGNNLIMRDKSTGEPIQQMYGTRECDGRDASNGMQQWPTYRMTFRGFRKAFPEGKVFLNKIPKPSQNPLLFILDHLVEAIFLWCTVPHHTNESLLFETMDVEDDRLRMKELVWGFNVGSDSVAYTEDFVRENNNLVNATVGGRNVVIAYDEDYESLGVYYNDNSGAVAQIDFWGASDQGQLSRVETVKAASYWCVWVNYFPETDVNRVLDCNQAAAA